MASAAKNAKRTYSALVTTNDEDGSASWVKTVEEPKSKNELKVKIKEHTLKKKEAKAALAEMKSNEPKFFRRKNVPMACEMKAVLPSTGEEVQLDVVKTDTWENVLEMACEKLGLDSATHRLTLVSEPTGVVGQHTCFDGDVHILKKDCANSSGAGALVTADVSSSGAGGLVTAENAANGKDEGADKEPEEESEDVLGDSGSSTDSSD